MTEYKPKLIVLRGNSGSGKSVVAQKIQEVSDRKIVWVEQDYIRRKMLKEKDVDGNGNIAPLLVSQIVEFAIGHGCDVILEGILNFPRYGNMLQRLADFCPEHYFFYFDISLEETLRRHATKPNAYEFGKEDMERWYRAEDVTGFIGEVVISEKHSQDEVVKLIIEQAGL